MSARRRCLNPCSLVAPAPAGLDVRSFTCTTAHESLSKLAFLEVDQGRTPATIFSNVHDKVVGSVLEH